MRIFDSRDSWLDLDGKPLIGRVKFCKLHTTVLENIYDYQGTALSNPIFTNTIGQLSNQVFLQDKTNYTVIFEKYIGNGDFTDEYIDDPDIDNWSFQYSCDNLWNTYGIEVDSTTFQLVNNITDLRNLDPLSVTERDDSRVIILGGYNKIGDKSQVMYIWNENSIENDNGGSVIKVNNIATGRWELCNTFSSDGIDVRHFGVFGTESKQEATDLMSLQIGIANTYAASIGLPLYFPTINGITWYKFNNLNIAGAKFGKETKVFGNSGTSSIITVYSEDEYLDVFKNSDYNAVFTIRGATVKTSWGVNSNNCIYDPSYKLIVDSVINTFHKTFIGIIIDCQYDIFENVNLYSCTINSVGKLGGNSIFRNCRLTEQMFIDSVDFDTITVYDDDIIDIEEWPTTSKWLTLAAQNNNKVLDFRGRTLDSSCILNWITSVTYKNAKFDGYNVKQTTIVFDNCSGTLNIGSNYLNSVALYNTDITIANMNVQNITDILFARHSTISCNENITVPDIQLAYSTINAENNVFYSDRIELNYCTINTALSAPELIAKDTMFMKDIQTGVPTLINCTIQAILTQNRGSTINFLIQNCVFGPNAYHYFSIDQNTVVTGKWIGNIGQGNNPIRIDMTSPVSTDSLHTYTYENNIGTFLPTTNSITLNLEPVITLPMPVFPTTYQNKAYFIDPGLIVNPAGLSWYSGILLDLDAQNIPVFCIGSPAFDAEVEVTWKSNNGTFYTGNLYEGYGHAYAKRSFEAVSGMIPSTDKMRVWVQQFIQQCEDNTFTDVKAKVTVTVKR